MASVTQVRYTPEDLLHINDRPMPELVDGELLERERGQKADGIAATVLYFLMTFIKPRSLGLINGSQGSYQIFPEHPNRVRIPDVSFTRRERLDPDGPAEGHGRIAPDLVVEVVSPNDTAYDLEAKFQDYLSAGIPLMWWVYPGLNFVRVHELGKPSRDLHVGQVLDGGDVLPGFDCQVSELFT